MIDDQSEAGEWDRAIKRGCLEGRVSEYGAPHIEDRDWPEQLDYLKSDHRPTRNEWVGRLLGIIHYDYDRGHTRPGSLLSHEGAAST